MFMELVAKPIPNAMDDSTPRNLATNSSSSSWMSRFPDGRERERERETPCQRFTCSTCRTLLEWAWPAEPAGIQPHAVTMVVRTSTPPPVRCSIQLLTHLAAGAAHAGAVLLRRLQRRVGARPAVLGEAQVVVRAHVDDVPHHAACVSDTDGHTFPGQTTRCFRSAPAH